MSVPQWNQTQRVLPMGTVSSDLISLPSWAPVRAADNSKPGIVRGFRGATRDLAITKGTLVSPVWFATEPYAFSEASQHMCSSLSITSQGT